MLVTIWSWPSQQDSVMIDRGNRKKRPIVSCQNCLFRSCLYSVLVDKNTVELLSFILTLQLKDISKEKLLPEKENITIISCLRRRFTRRTTIPLFYFRLKCSVLTYDISVLPIVIWPHLIFRTHSSETFDTFHSKQFSLRPIPPQKGIIYEKKHCFYYLLKNYFDNPPQVKEKHCFNTHYSLLLCPKCWVRLRALFSVCRIMNTYMKYNKIKQIVIRGSKLNKNDLADSCDVAIVSVNCHIYTLYMFCLDKLDLEATKALCTLRHLKMNSVLL